MPLTYLVNRKRRHDNARRSYDVITNSRAVDSTEAQ